MGLYLEVLLIALMIDTLLLIIAYSLKTEALTYLSYSLSFFLTTLYVFFRHSDRSITAAVITVVIVLWSVRLGVSLSQRILKKQVDHRSDDKREPFFRFGAFWDLQATAVRIVPLLETFWKKTHDVQEYHTRYMSVTPTMLPRRTL